MDNTLSSNLQKLADAVKMLIEEKGRPVTGKEVGKRVLETHPDYSDRKNISGDLLKISVNARSLYNEKKPRLRYGDKHDLLFWHEDGATFDLYDPDRSKWELLEMYVDGKKKLVPHQVDEARQPQPSREADAVDRNETQQRQAEAVPNAEMVPRAPSTVDAEISLGRVDLALRDALGLTYLSADSPNLIPLNPWAPTALRMVKTAQQTTNAANGQAVLQTIKNKNNAFASQDEFIRYVESLVEHQHGCCAISGLPIQPDSWQDGDDEMKASLDRIDSSGHYEAGNLQVVCRFINHWKGADQNAQFVRLMDALRKHWQLGLSEKTI